MKRWWMTPTPHEVEKSYAINNEGFENELAALDYLFRCCASAVPVVVESDKSDDWKNVAANTRDFSRFSDCAFISGSHNRMVHRALWWNVIRKTGNIMTDATITFVLTEETKERLKLMLDLEEL